MTGTLTIIAIVISSVVVLVTLGRISRQLDSSIKVFKKISKHLLAGKSGEDVTISRIQREVDLLKQRVKTMNGDIEWKG